MSTVADGRREAPSLRCGRPGAGAPLKDGEGLPRGSCWHQRRGHTADPDQAIGLPVKPIIHAPVMAQCFTIPPRSTRHLSAMAGSVPPIASR